MRLRELGSEGLITSVLGYGCMGLSDFYATGRPDEARSVAIIQKAIALGVTMLDTADMYGPFKNEELVGKAVRGRRDAVVLATKFGIVRDVVNPGRRAINGRPEYVRSCCEASLRRLNVDYIDLYYQHRVDPSTPIEETVGAMSELVREGKVRYIGLSEAAPETIRRAHRIHPITAVQSEYSLWTRDPEGELLETLRELRIGFVAYSPLGRGFLGGRFHDIEEIAADDYRRSSPRFQGDNFRRNIQLLDRIEEMARARGCTPAQLALSWLLNQGDDIVAIPGTTNVARLEENIGAAEIKLTPNERKEIDALAPPGVAAGARYNEDAMSSINR